MAEPCGDAAEVEAHHHAAIGQAVRSRSKQKPFVLIGRTVKGKGVSYMENVPIWHYRSPSPAEYQQAVREIQEAA